MKFKKLKGKTYKVVSLGSKAYEKIFDPVAQIACFYEDDNRKISKDTKN